MYEVRVFTTKNCSPMGTFRTENYQEAKENFDFNSKNFMWGYMVEILEDKEKVLESFEKILDN